MLTIQRASAGSGKTFTLAKTFIKLYIGIKKSNGNYRLRTSEELSDAHSHILAVTFTNKATNEMKQRVVEKLAALGNEHADKRADYLDDFIKEFDTDETEIRRTCKNALSILLHNYTDFQISTIDSFFQGILRSFAYETEINDSYQVELDDEYISQIGVDTMLSQIKERNPESDDIRFIIAMMMKENLAKGGKWNIFNKSITDYGASLYAQLFQFAAKMQSEDYKSIQTEMENYFRANTNFRDRYTEIMNVVSVWRKESYTYCREEAQKIIDLFKIHGLDFENDSAHLLHGLVHGILNAKSDKSMKLKPFDYTKPQGVFNATANKRGGYNKLFTEWGENNVAILNNKYRTWQRDLLLIKLYTSRLHHIWLLGNISRNMENFRINNDLIQLSDTNHILRSIINIDDTPFIYEKIGYYLNHYLIDEFQDTSTMQWRNLEPLLSESLANNNDNLIIGDAKQSIYRFRNADPDLITSEVQKHFRQTQIAGTTKTENSNWRSSREIVQFNNTIFSILPKLLDIEKPNPRNMGHLYEGAVQNIQKREHQGYVEINFFSRVETSDLSDNSTTALPKHLDKMGELICDLVNRGYRQGDIAFLVEENRQGQQLIEALLSHNLKNIDNPDKQIEFVSEESLRIAESSVVKTIIAILEMSVNGYGRDNPDISHKSNRRASVSELYFGFNLRMATEKNPTDITNAVTHALDEDINSLNTLRSIIERMQTVALPALVEAVIENFITPAARKNQAIYIAAFQDKVLEYCEMYPADTASFLKWWNNNSIKFSISSPDGIDAVQIMTVHKSKGLEFKCVILPFMINSFSPGRRTETVWVQPLVPEKYDLNSLLPPYVPIELNQSLIDTPYKHKYQDYIGKYLMDKLNVAYVAFTRAIDELYIYAPVKQNTKTGEIVSDSSTGFYLNKLLSGIVDGSLTSDLDTSSDSFIPYGALTYSEDKMHFFFGSHPIPRIDEDTKDTICDIENYQINSNLDILYFQEESTLSSYQRNIEDDTIPDPRSTGCMMHYILSKIKVASDIEPVVKRLIIKGTIDEKKAQQILGSLQIAISHPQASKWFMPELQIINERSIIRPGKKTHRPDRIIVTPTKRAIVIDYKFGDKALESNDEGEKLMKRYRQQITGYVKDLKATELFPGGVEGWLWFVGSGKTIFVEQS